MYICIMINKQIFHYLEEPMRRLQHILLLHPGAPAVSLEGAQSDLHCIPTKSHTDHRSTGKAPEGLNLAHCHEPHWLLHRCRFTKSKEGLNLALSHRCEPGWLSLFVLKKPRNRGVPKKRVCHSERCRRRANTQSWIQDGRPSELITHLLINFRSPITEGHLPVVGHPQGKKGKEPTDTEGHHLTCGVI